MVLHLESLNSGAKLNKQNKGRRKKGNERVYSGTVFPQAQGVPTMMVITQEYELNAVLQEVGAG